MENAWSLILYSSHYIDLDLYTFELLANILKRLKWNILTRSEKKTSSLCALILIRTSSIYVNTKLKWILYYMQVKCYTAVGVKKIFLQVQHNDKKNRLLY